MNSSKLQTFDFFFLVFTKFRYLFQPVLRGFLELKWCQNHSALLQPRIGMEWWQRCIEERNRREMGWISRCADTCTIIAGRDVFNSVYSSVITEATFSTKLAFPKNALQQFLASMNSTFEKTLHLCSCWPVRVIRCLCELFSLPNISEQVSHKDFSRVCAFICLRLMIIHRSIKTT